MTSRLDWDKDKIWKRDSGSAGKGDAPRNLSNQFRDNFDEINWTPREMESNGVPVPKRFKKKYK
jgi:hypothetical protein